MKAQELLKKYSSPLDPKELDKILALAIGKSSLYLYKNPDKEISVAGIKAFKKLLRLRLSGYPLAYLMGYKEFFGLKFLLNKNTLVPRPESELLVEEALKFIKKNNSVLDIGTGSGCLVLSLAKNFTPANYTATDISSRALKTAKTNARKLGLKNKITFIKSNLLKNIAKSKFDIVLANLPYLTPIELKEPSIKKEPRLALLSGKEGLAAYSRLLKNIDKYLAKKYLLLMEINPGQKEKIELLIKQSLPEAKIEFLKDLSNNTRVIKIRSNN